MKDKVKDIARTMARFSKADLDELSTALMENGISATLYRFSPASSIWDEKDEYDVVMTSVGKKRIRVVKVIKDFLGLTLKDAMGITNSAPTVVMEFASKADALALRNALENVGASVEIKEIGELKAVNHGNV